jgi:hypothetical protein
MPKESTVVNRNRRWNVRIKNEGKNQNSIFDKHRKQGGPEKLAADQLQVTVDAFTPDAEQLSANQA